MIDSSLPSSGTYWFEVKSSKEGNSVLLKMLSKADGRKEPSGAPQFILKLLKEANVARTKEHVDFLQRAVLPECRHFFFLNEYLAFTCNDFIHCAAGAPWDNPKRPSPSIEACSRIRK
ncbi:MAG: hypothetical protein ACQEWW_00675 [Bacillota bacterium]